MSKKSIKTLLLVEDNPGDAGLLRRMLRQWGLPDLKLTHVERMSEAEKHLAEQAVDIILLDLNLPKKDGREVLEEIKESPALKSIPVVILTTSASETDILGSYQHHANCYITKPVDLAGFLKVVKSIDNFWLSVVKLPREARS